MRSRYKRRAGHVLFEKGSKEENHVQSRPASLRMYSYLFSLFLHFCISGKSNQSVAQHGFFVFPNYDCSHHRYRSTPIHIFMSQWLWLAREGIVALSNKDKNRNHCGNGKINCDTGVISSI